jgi:hypothetical protein
MPSIFWKLIEGAERGQKVARSADFLMKSYFALGIKNIEVECNRVAASFRDTWSLRASSTLMSEYHLSITYGDGCKELEPLYELFEPDSILVRILDSYHPLNPDIPASTELSEPINPLITIYLKALEFADEEIIEKKSRNTLESIINHELLHACGDSPRLRCEIHDGVIRQTIVPREAIMNLSSKK